MAIRTIFSMVEDCARGERQGWTEFVRDFAGIARCLLAQYFPLLAPDPDKHVVAVFRRAGIEDGTVFAALKFTNEREFMMVFRELVFAYGREQWRRTLQGTAGSPILPPDLTLDQVRAVMKDLNVLEQELLWLVIKGYDAQQIADIMMNASATAEAVKCIADERLANLVLGKTPAVIAASALVLIQLAEQSKSDQCLPLKTFNNLVNGQISWREREQAEEHMRTCLYCIDRLTSFQEMIRLRKDEKALDPAQVGVILDQLPIAAAKPRGILARLFASR